MPESLQAVPRRLTSDDPETRYPGAAELVEDLERTGVDVPANGTAWERMLRQVREEMGGDRAMRQSA
jgi:hypothetical protein